MFEKFPDEIILLIFSFIEFNELYRGFSSLNSRIEGLLNDNLTSLHVRLTANLSLPIEKFLSRINNLTLIEWTPNNVSFLLADANLVQLNCLNLESTSYLYLGQPTNRIVHRIFSLPNLHKCRLKLSSTIYILDSQIPISASICHLNLSMITLDMLLIVLRQVPELCSLRVWLNSNGRKFDERTYDKNCFCLKLKQLIIGLHNDIEFIEFSFLLLRMPELRSLELDGCVWDQEFLNGRRWKTILLGESSFALLNRIKITLNIRRTAHTGNVLVVLSRFHRKIFYDTHFSVTYDQMLWFELRCLCSRA